MHDIPGDYLIVRRYQKPTTLLVFLTTTDTNWDASGSIVWYIWLQHKSYLFLFRDNKQPGRNGHFPTAPPKSSRKQKQKNDGLLLNVSCIRTYPFLILNNVNMRMWTLCKYINVTCLTLSWILADRTDLARENCLQDL